MSEEDYIDSIKAYRKNYYTSNREKLKTTNRENYEKQKEARLTKMKEYREKNKDKLKEVAKSVIKCSCGREITKSNLAKHITSKIHNKEVAGNTKEANEQE